ncbi:hypothetical protein [Candidatus Enterococcus mansonii]|uniref:DUF5105 domain-containing protein n=1 Tax=Candidatus Enterococcus mansonii TaxID=1834181 RepID=A0A242CC61_9ENTE|nr:hypothetical protein [Enterococcus sp. 4G2_DIV0659]OTO07845.1 hypothetical protein A5880_002115 [Enterococcus sp. 4G2_DIV0659]
MKLKIFIAITMFCSLLAVTSCSNSNPHAQLPKKDQQIVWSGARERSFGDSDYVDLSSKDEAMKVMKDKYKLSIPDYYEKAIKTIDSSLSSETVKADKLQYLIYAKNEDLELRTIYPFYEGENLKFVAIVSLKYKFLRETKKARLRIQAVDIKNASSDQEFPKDKVILLAKELGSIMRIDNSLIKSGIKGYEKQIKEANRQFSNESVPVVSNRTGLDKDKELGKSISALYDGFGKLTDVYAEISDDTK